MVEQTLAMHDSTSHNAGKRCAISCFNDRVDVVAAVIERDGRVLICQRKGGRHGHKWEFPGGKVERGESAAEALKRELCEELAIDAQIGDQMEQHEIRYGNGPLLRLQFFRVSNFTGEPKNLQFERIVWEEPGRLPQYDFLEGDLEFVKRLANGHRRA